MFKFTDEQKGIRKENSFTIHTACFAKNTEGIFSNDHKYFSNLKYVKVQER